MIAVHHGGRPRLDYSMQSRGKMQDGNKMLHLPFFDPSQDV